MRSPTRARCMSSIDNSSSFGLSVMTSETRKSSRTPPALARMRWRFVAGDVVTGE